MTELSRSLIAAAREGLAPDPEVAARVRAKVAAAVAAGAAVATSSHAAAATGAPAAAPSVAATSGGTSASTAAPSVAATVASAGSSSLAIKLGTALVALGVASVGVAVVARDTDRVTEVPPLDVAPVAVEEISAGVRVAAPNESLALPEAPRSRNKAAASSVSAVQPAVPAIVAASPSAEPASSMPEPASARERASMPEPMSTPEPASLSREVELIDLAMVSLRKNAPLAAIEAIRVFERETLGKGQMAEEAAAIEIEARCMLREDVTAALARFDRKWPESAQRERIQTACFARK